MTGTRRFSQAISEGDGISIVVPVADPGTARAAEEQGAEALALHAAVESVRDATSLPLLWRPHGSPDLAQAAGADACVMPVLEMGEAAGHPHNAAREVFGRVGGVEQPMPAPRFGRTPSRAPSPPVRAGADTDTVLAAAGLSPEEIIALRERGAVW